MKLDKYNTWERYFDPKHPKHKYQVARHNWFMDRICGPRLLDVGCSGGCALFLAGKNDSITELAGVDVMDTHLALARERLACYADKTVSIYSASADAMPIDDGYFDCVICGETLEHVKNDCAAMKEIRRVTKVGGTLLATVPKDGHLSAMHVRLYDRKRFDGLIRGCDFDIIESGEMPASINGKYLLTKAVAK